MDKELPPAFGDEMNHDDGGVGSDTNHDKLVEAYSKGTSPHIFIVFLCVIYDKCHLCHRNVVRPTFGKRKLSEFDLKSSFKRFV